MTDPHVHELPHGGTEPGRENYLSGPEVRDRENNRHSMARGLEMFAAQIESGEIAALELKWDGGPSAHGTVHRPGRDLPVNIDLVFGTATVRPIEK